MRAVLSLDELTGLTSKFARKAVSREVVEASLGTGIPSPFYHMDPMIEVEIDGQTLVVDPVLVRFVRTLAHLVEK